jgi:hypothetical protein
MCSITLTIKFTSHILKILYYVIVLFLYFILHTVEKNIYFHYLIILLLCFYFFHPLNLIIRTKPYSIFIPILIPSNIFISLYHTILKFIKILISITILSYSNILYINYFKLQYIHQILIYFYTRFYTLK